MKLVIFASATIRSFHSIWNEITFPMRRCIRVHLDPPSLACVTEETQRTGHAMRTEWKREATDWRA